MKSVAFIIITFLWVFICEKKKKIQNTETQNNFLLHLSQNSLLHLNTFVLIIDIGDFMILFEHFSEASMCYAINQHLLTKHSLFLNLNHYQFSFKKPWVLTLLIHVPF